jgi:fructose-bisphosphate aldolase class I
MKINQMLTTARELMADNKGVLAMDESMPNLHKQLAAVGIAPSEENRRAYRELMITAPHIEDSLSGAILGEETIGQSTADGLAFMDILRQKKIIAGVKVDEGTVEVGCFPGEKVKAGLDHLSERLRCYSKQGLRFTKWRAVIRIGTDTATDGSIIANTHALARYAALCQEADILPIVEPEVLMDGDHDIDRSAEVTKAVLHELFRQLSLQQVHLRCLILKPNMVISGLAASVQASAREVAEATIDCLMETVPDAVAGIAFLSSGQSPELATEHLNAINSLNEGFPWPVTFSYSRAIQQAAMQVWLAKGENVPAAQRKLLERLGLLTLARRGLYQPRLETGCWFTSYG